jgi:hypothetical protein
MGQCKAQTSRTLPGVVRDQSIPEASRTCTATKEQPPSYAKLRGLDLLKSCARYYENRVGVATATVRPSHLLRATSNQPAIPPSRHAKWSIGTLAVMCSCLLILPGLGVATIMSERLLSEPAEGITLTVNGASGAAAQLPAPAITASVILKSAVAEQTPSNEQTDIIVHKVKTQPITGEAFSPDQSIR